MALMVSEMPDDPRTRGNFKSSKAKFANFLLRAAKVGCAKDQERVCLFLAFAAEK